ncbi:MAG: YgiQ family radical SAM protein [Deltaproteobacteria bacterium]|nr:YgiQ family radical SAM protein [Deltaproteobacteria bacterium]
MELVPLRRNRNTSSRNLRAFLPTTREEMDARGWDQLDVLIITGDAYVDHPAFGPVLIARFLEGRGYKVGIIAQPDWSSPEDLKRMGTPRLFVGIAGGNLDSMLNKLTAQKKTRAEDQYSPGGRANARPNRATIVYSNLARQAFGQTPIVLGGIEASLRRIAHYDYWSDSVRRAILLDAKADLLVFGMGERSVWEIAKRLDAGKSVKECWDIEGTAHVRNRGEWETLPKSEYVADHKVLWLPSYEDVVASKDAFLEMSRAFQYETNPGNGRPLLQVHGHQAVYFNSPAKPLDTTEMDGLYDLPFVRQPHWSYNEVIPAFETVKHSVVTMRGCFGGCTFCSITEHEGRHISSRSEENILREVRALRRMDDFKGVITDVGGPTANMYKMHCKSEAIESKCRLLSCVHPGICENLVTDHQPLLSVLKVLRREEGVKKVFVASGVRYDLATRSPEFIDAMARHHTGGLLSVAPEHNDPTVLNKMKKPGIEHYDAFVEQFQCASEKAGKDQHLVPYFISGHPGSTLESMVGLAQYLKREGLKPRQVQDFIPTPMSMATCMYYTGRDPFTREPVYTAREMADKRLQKSLLFYWDPEHHDEVREALTRAGRADLIGTRPDSLVPPATGKGSLSIHVKRAAERRTQANNPRAPGNKNSPRAPQGKPPRRPT